MHAFIDSILAMEVSSGFQLVAARSNDTIFQGILDFSREFDVSLMDKVVMAFYTGAGQEVRVVLAAGGTLGLTECYINVVYSNKWLSKS